jgi:hypothetical protein
VLSRCVHLESEEEDSDNVVPEDKGAQDVRILAVLFLGFFGASATSHELNDVQDLVEKL